MAKPPEQAIRFRYEDPYQQGRSLLNINTRISSTGFPTDLKSQEHRYYRERVLKIEVLQAKPSPTNTTQEPQHD